MGTTELSATRVRNQKRRQSRKRRNDARASDEHGGVMVKTLVTKSMTEKDIMKAWTGSWDVGCPEREPYTDKKWRAECEQRRDELRKEHDEYMKKAATRQNQQLESHLKANTRQIGGDHYKNMGVEPWDVVDTWPIEQQIGYHRGGVLKYTMRLGNKDERLQEAKKALHYAEKLVEILESKYGNA